MSPALSLARSVYITSMGLRMYRSNDNCSWWTMNDRRKQNHESQTFSPTASSRMEAERSPTSPPARWRHRACQVLRERKSRKGKRPALIKDVRSDSEARSWELAVDLRFVSDCTFTPMSAQERSDSRPSPVKWPPLRLRLPGGWLCG